MTKRNQIYKCAICGNITEVLHSGAGSLVCCGQNMGLIEEISDPQKEGTEKHFPVIEKEADNFYIVDIGTTPHPMEESHFIEWIEIKTEDERTYKKFLEPDATAQARFCSETKIVTIKAYCNIHGLWKLELR